MGFFDNIGAKVYELKDSNADLTFIPVGGVVKYIHHTNKFDDNLNYLGEVDEITFGECVIDKRPLQSHPNQKHYYGDCGDCIFNGTGHCPKCLSEERHDLPVYFKVIK